MSPYSPERRTAVVLCGTGAGGAYHAGVLRALQEAGVKIDLLAGHGLGAASAALAAIDGGPRLWDANGIWQSARAQSLYGWTRPALAAALYVGMLAVLLIVSGLAAAAGVVLPRWWTAVLVTAIVAGAAAAAAVANPRGARRRARGQWWWRLLGAPIDARAARDLVARSVWEQIRGAAPVEMPSPQAVGRRYAELLLENLGQPGFRELVLVTTDLDARRDIVAALLREPFRAEFFAPRPDRDRRADVLDLAGLGREHALDVVAGGLTPPFIAEPALITFAPDTFWRGETHRLCDRSGAVNRLLEEVAAAGATQVIVVTAVTTVPVPHQLRVPRLDPRSRVGEFLAAAEASAIRDALEMARLRFDSVYVVAPAHNPIGPFDLAGAYDEASDRRQDLRELMDRAYEDAYRQFIEPVVGASGDHLARPGGAAGAAAGRAHADTVFDETRPSGLRDFD